MLSLSPSARIFVCMTPTDMRRQFDGLSALVTHTLRQDALSGDYYLFFNRSCTLCKILCWDRDGYLILAKRLAQGRFQKPASPGQVNVIEIDAVTLSMILAGVDLASVKRRKRYVRPLPSGCSVEPALITATIEM